MKGETVKSKIPPSPALSGGVLCAIVFLLYLSVRASGISGGEGGAAYLRLFAAQTVVFIYPCILYVRLRGEKLTLNMRLSPFGADKIPLVLLSSVALITGCLFIGALIPSSAVDAVSLYGDFNFSSAADAVILLFCFALLPALFEELLFRSVLLAEFSFCGIIGASVLSSLLFSMLHFSIEKIPSCLYTGALLCLVAYATNSVLACAAVHFIYNLFFLFGGKIALAVTTLSENYILMYFILGSVLLVALIFVFGECQRIFAALSRQNKPSPPEAAAQKKAEGFALALLSPSFLACAVIFAIAVMMYLY